MNSHPPTFERTLQVVEQVVEVLARHRVGAVLIGAMALAVHRYPRDTEDIDLAVAIQPGALAAIACDLRARGFEVEEHAPNPTDPLGGVLNVHSSGSDPIQIVNFLNPPAGGFPRLVEDAQATAAPLVSGSALRVVDLSHLIAFKLYAGGRKSQLDVLELLDRNPQLDLEGLRALCQSYRLDRALERLLAMARDEGEG